MNKKKVIVLVTVCIFTFLLIAACSLTTPNPTPTITYTINPTTTPTITFTPYVTCSERDLPVVASTAVALAREVAIIATTTGGGGYSENAGKGWDFKEGRFVDPQQILEGYTSNEKTKEPGIDCSGLVFWAYGKACGHLSNYDKGPFKCWGADNYYHLNTTPIFENELLPGDLLFFDKNGDGKIDHVAMYLGGSDPNRDVVEAKDSINGIIFSNKCKLKQESTFKGFHRVIWLDTCPSPTPTP